MTQSQGYRSVRSWSVPLVVVGLLRLAGPSPDATAQPFAPGPPRSPDAPEGRRLIETIKIWKMTEALNLDEGQAAKLFPKLAQLEASRREFFRRQRILRNELAELLKQHPRRMKRSRQDLTSWIALRPISGDANRPSREGCGLS
ncbi:MAG: hypothetical protein M5R38_14125 [Candidatus Methylomirabilis sp.]|nr:hypothetical protein [Candidatus Methylomirabilis sp.]